jgi:hypothetical protein
MLTDCRLRLNDGWIHLFFQVVLLKGASIESVKTDGLVIIGIIRKHLKSCNYQFIYCMMCSNEFQ